jgi:hypothetical protein
MIRRREDELGSKVPFNITFHALTYTVVKGDKRIEILKGISGTCTSGRVLAIMGASGAGKTTLVSDGAPPPFSHTHISPVPPPPPPTHPTHHPPTNSALPLAE